MARNKKKGIGRPQSVEIQTDSLNGLRGFNTELPVLQSKTPRMPRLATPMTGGAYSKGMTGGMDIMAGKISMPILRRIASTSGLEQAILSRRFFQMTQISKPWRVDGEVGFKVLHKKHYDNKFQVPQQLLDLAADIENMIENPWGILEPTFSGFTSRFVQDLCVINHPAIELGLNSKGVPIAFSMIDGGNIYPTFAALKMLLPAIESKYGRVEDKYGIITPNSNAYSKLAQYASDEFKVNISDVTDHLYINNGVVTAGYTSKNLLILPIMPTTDISEVGFPPSMLERSIRLILAEMLAMSYNMNYFQFGTMVDTMIGIVGDYDDEHIQEFTEMIRLNHTGTNGAHRMPVVPLRSPDDIKIFNVKQNNRDMVYSEFMNLVTSFTCAIHGMPPEEINIRQNGSGKFMFEGNHDSQIQQNKEEGFSAIRQHIATCMNIGIVKRINPDLEFTWMGFDADVSKSRKEMALKELTSGGISVREYRLATAQTAVPENMQDSDVDMFQSQAWLQMQAQKQQAQTQQDQQEHEIEMAKLSDNIDKPDNPDEPLSPQDDGYQEPDFGVEEEQ